MFRFTSWPMALLVAMTMTACQPPRPDLAEAEASVPVLPPLTVVTLNLWHDKQDWPRRQDSIIATLESLRPDVVLLQEVLQDKDLTNQAQSLAQALGYQYRFYSSDPPAQARRYGNAILTRHRILAIAQQPLQPLDDYRIAGFASIEIDGRPVNVYVTHLHYKPEGGDIRRQQVDGLVDFIAATRGHAPSLLGGDFNTTDSAPELQPLLPMFASAYPAAHPGQPLDTPEHTTLNPHLDHWPQRVDHLFFQQGAFRVLESRIIFDQPETGGSWASDHFGLLARLQPLRGLPAE